MLIQYCSSLSVNQGLRLHLDQKEQQPSFYATIEAPHGENYGECVEKIKDMSAVIG